MLKIIKAMPIVLLVGCNVTPKAEVMKPVIPKPDSFETDWTSFGGESGTFLEETPKLYKVGEKKLLSYASQEALNKLHDNNLNELQVTVLEKRKASEVLNCVVKTKVNLSNKKYDLSYVPLDFALHSDIDKTVVVKMTKDSIGLNNYVRLSYRSDTVFCSLKNTDELLSNIGSTMINGLIDWEIEYRQKQKDKTNEDAKANMRKLADYSALASACADSGKLKRSDTKKYTDSLIARAKKELGELYDKAYIQSAYLKQKKYIRSPLSGYNLQAGCNLIRNEIIAESDKANINQF